MTPVVAVLKSMWEAPRVRALKESLRGIRVAIPFFADVRLCDFFGGGGGGRDGGG
jgi:hypothetical protein